MKSSGIDQRAPSRGHSVVRNVIATLLAVATLVALFVAFFRGDDAIERASNAPQAPRGSGDVAASELAAGSTDAAARRDVAEHTRRGAGVPSGATFRELLNVVDGISGEPLAQFAVVSYDALGEARRVTPDDVVFEHELEPDGAWIISADGHLPTWLDPRLPAIARQPDSQPVILALDRTAILRVHFEAPPAGREPVASIGIQSRAGNRMVIFDSGTDKSVAIGCLARLEATATEAVQLLARVRRDTGGRFQLPGLLRREELEVRETLSFDTGASFPPPELPLSLELEGRETFWLDRGTSDHRSEKGPFVGSHEFVVPAGRNFTVGLSSSSGAHFASGDPERRLTDALANREHTGMLSLAPGEVRELNVAFATSAALVVRFPADARDTALRLDLYDRAASEPTTPRRVRIEPRRTDDGAYEWPELPACRIELIATWSEAGLDAGARHTIDLAPGEVFDLGVLAPHPATSVVLVPRFVGANGAPMPSVDVASLAIRAHIWPTLGPTDAGRTFDLVHGVPLAVAGLEPGEYTLRITAVERADHGALIENAGGLTGAELIEALRRDLEASAVRLAASAAPIAVIVEGHTRVDVEVPIERSAP